MIYPIIIWPFSKPGSSRDLEFLFNYLEGIQDGNLARPSIFINYQSRHWMDSEYHQIVALAESKSWRIKWTWSVDTCQTWLYAFGSTFNFAKSHLKKDENTSFLLLPGDFHYSCEEGEKSLAEVKEAFHSMVNPAYDIVLGELSTRKSDFKEQIDIYGTWRLLQIWFPEKHEELTKVTTKPRSEFIALSRSFLENQLALRWFPYSQTLVILLRLLENRKKDRIKVFNLGELKEDMPKKPIFEALTQFERIERVLKFLWREANGKIENIETTYSKLSDKSEEVIRQSINELKKVLDSQKQ